MRIEPGTVLARRYRADVLLGRGGMGEVWRCFDIEQQADVAVKALRPELLRASWAQRLFHGEVAAVARLAHPAIVPVYDLVAADDGTALLIMEPRDGRPLSALVPRAPAWPLVRAVLMQLLAALAYAHARGVLHLDIKPDNLIVAGEGEALRVTVVDFGISRIRRPGQGVEQWVATEALIGTVAYLAPERCAGVVERFGPWTDLYSVGVLAFELCSGRRPFSEGPPLPTLLRRMSEPAPPLVPRGDDVPEAFVDLCTRLLAIQPRDRPLRAADVMQELREMGEAPRSEHSPAARRAPPADDARHSDRGSLLPANTLRAASLVPLFEVPPEGDSPSSVLVPATQGSGARTAALSVSGETAAAFRAEPPAPRAGAYGLFGLRDLPLFGRTDERSALWSSVSQTVLERRPRLVLLEGPAGAGKSRLARDALERAEELGICLGMQTAWSAEASGDQGLRALTENVLECRGAPLSSVRARLAVLLERIPGDHRGFAREAELLLRPPLDAAPDAGLPLRVAVDLVCRCASVRPVLLWLDDVHHARGDALALVNALLAAEPPVPVCIVATARDDEVDRAAARALLALEGCQRVRVERMDPEAMQQLLRGMLDVEPPLCELLAVRAEGNPLFATELLRQLVQKGSLERHQGRYRLAPGETADAIPADIGALWDRRIDHCRAERRDLALLASMRERISLEIVGHLATVLPSVELSLSRALAAGLCAVQGGAYVWAHGLLRAHLVAGIDRATAAELHALAATALEPLVGREDVQEERARHLSRAAGQARRACEAMLEAGLWSFRHAENEERRARFETLVDWSQAAGFADLEARGAAELSYLEAETGSPARAMELIAAAREALVAGSHSEAAAWVALRHSQTVRLFGHLDEGVSATEEALSLSRAAGVAEVEAIALLQRALDAYRRRDLAASRELIHEAVRNCRARGDRVNEAQALRVLITVEPESDGLAAVERAVQLAHAAGALRVELVCKQVWVGALWARGQRTRAREEALLLSEEAARRSLRQTVAITELQSGVWAVTADDFTAARAHLDRAVSWGATGGAHAERVIAHALELVLALAASDEPRARRAADALDQVRNGYDDDDLRALLARATALASGDLAHRLTALRC